MHYQLISYLTDLRKLCRLYNLEIMAWQVIFSKAVTDWLDSIDDQTYEMFQAYLRGEEI